MRFTLFKKSQGCQPCVATQRVLDRHGLREGQHYDVRYLDLDAEALRFAKGLGHNAAPVVYVNEDRHWSGFWPGRVDELAQEVDRGDG
ncbi:glutaredoxin [Salana multivorans]|uniref:Glutaredoxin n=1 Tax=Salana multivorans TaxID=120377 RepID=A0A3N2D6P4_9MICO|nr:glutaredoxin family protein [Salana multivorans]ROR95457.1 glutaredoxin [Salana multivorans]ROR95541.1 glutaredoxin [Salana multivorans]